ncbi:sensor histidine kinase [Aquipuribacter sp. SD81]|uniref:sensor histidine kinase n=1 Tax=Aquipuribacter sp. SD81 TaxID=3127703 RepID=UPI0030166E93
MLLLAGVGVLAAGLAVAVGAAGAPEAALPLLAFAVVGASTLGLGCLAWLRRPYNGSGLLLCVTGVLSVLAVAGNAEDPLLRAVGFVAGQAPIAALAHVLLAFPSGRLRGRLATALVAGLYLLTVGGDAVRLLDAGRLGLPPGQDGAVGDGVRTVQAVLGGTLLSVAVVVLLVRVLRPSRSPRPRRDRWGLGVVRVWGAVALAFFPLSANLLNRLLGWSELDIFVAQVVLLLSTPAVLTVALLRSGFARMGRVDELGIALGGPAGRSAGLGAAVAEAVGDPSLRLTVVPGPAVPGDRPTPRASEAEPDRGRVLVQGRHGAVAEIDYDAVLLPDPGPVEAAGAVVALALEREQLTADLIASNRRVVASRARVVELADAERRRLAADLHDVLQARLVLVAMRAGRLAAELDATRDGDATTSAAEAGLTSLRAEVDDAITELRRLVHGVMPAVLMDAGLVPAVRELLDRVPVAVEAVFRSPDRPALPRAVASTAYFVLAEAVTNAVKHAHATRLLVRVERTGDVLVVELADDGVGGARLPSAATEPSHEDGRRPGIGLRGLVDRVEALAGHVVLDSPSGGGTRLRVELPCGS